MNFLLLFLVLMPIFGAFLSYLAGRNSKTLRDHLVLGLTALELLGALSLVLPASCRWFCRTSAGWVSVFGQTAFVP